MPTPPDRGRVAAKGKPLSARQLNEIQAQAADFGRLDLQGGTFSGGTQFTPDQPKTFYAKITAVGAGGWHSWQKVIWNAATGTFIDPPSPAMKGHKDTNGAYALGGGSGTIGDVVELKLFGARKVSSILHPVYSFTPLPASGSSAGKTNQIGATCFGVYGGTPGSTTGGNYGLGYTNCNVTIPDPSTPGATLTETWRLHHRTPYPLWCALKGDGSAWGKPDTGYAYYTAPLDSFTGVRGALVSAGVYDCLQYQLTPQVIFSNGITFSTIGWGAYFQDRNNAVWRCNGITPYRPLVETRGNIGASNASGAQLNLNTTNGWYITRGTQQGFVEFTENHGFTIIQQTLCNVLPQPYFAVIPSDVTASDR